MLGDLWYKAARTTVKAGQIPIPITENLIEILKILMTEEQAKFILIFRKPNLNMNEIKRKTDLDDDNINRLLNELMNGGIITGIPSNSTGIMVYRLMGPIPGFFEFSLMKGKTTEREIKLANLFDKLFDDLSQGIKNNYDSIMEQFKKFPPMTRVVPVEEKVDCDSEIVFPTDQASKFIDDYEVIAVSNCYCRHEKDLLDEPCKINAPKYNCLLFNKTAQFAIEHGFAELISKQDAKGILKKAEEIGLVHKAFHGAQDINRDLTGICSCCKCCCCVIQAYYRGAKPMHTLSSYIAKINEENCVGCETCVEKCPMETIEMEDSIAIINEDKCIGCGLCAHHCPSDAIELERTPLREVFVPPKRLAPEIVIKK